MTLVRFAQASAIIGWVCAAMPLLAQAPSVADVTIRVYDSFGIASDDIQRSQDIAGAILQAAGVRVSWRECWRDAGAIRRDMRVCGDTLHPTEVIVRIVADRSDQPRHRISLGYSLVVVNSGDATLATVFGNRVGDLAQRAHFDRNTVLGRAMAHEVGHLLLGTGEHASDGLMRAHWSDAALHDSNAWGFSPRRRVTSERNCGARAADSGPRRREASLAGESVVLDDARK